MRSFLLALTVACPLLAAAELSPEPAVPTTSIASSAEPGAAAATEPPAAKAQSEADVDSQALEVIATLHGQASFYAKRFHGRRTASGEPHDALALTAAHRSLPFGTWVRVKCLQSGREVKVRVNDRGPFTRGRIIDLSWAAADALGMLQSGTKSVKLQVLGAPKR